MSTVHALPLYETFNRSAFSHFINAPAGRTFRLVAGAAFLAAGWVYRDRMAGVAAMAWSILPLSAGAFDLCYISAVLGGPVSGAKIRAASTTGRRAGRGRRRPAAAPESA